MGENPCDKCAAGGWGGTSSELTYLGMDDIYGEVTLYRCRQCRRLWLHYHYENEAFTASGRWYHGLIPPDLEGSVTLENARAILEGLDSYWTGGSYVGGRVFQRRGKLDLFP
jgi:hypothetical protein